MDDKLILAALLQDRQFYEKSKNLIEASEFGVQGKIVYTKLVDFYKTDPGAAKVDAEILRSRITREHPKHADIFDKIIDTLYEPVSINNIYAEVVLFKKHALAMKLSGELLNPTANVVELMEDYLELEQGIMTQEVDDVHLFNDAPLDSFIAAFKPENLIRILPKSLNEHIGGGVPPQTHIVIYARPEAGKSLFSINMAVGFCMDGHKTLYIGNEDSEAAMMLRFMSRFSGMNRDAILKDPHAALRIAKEKGYTNLLFASIPAGKSVHTIEHLVKEHRPKALLIDQLRHIGFQGISGETEQITRAGKEARRLAKQYDMVVVSVTQAGESADNKLVLEQGDCYMSKTSLSGDADILLGIGANDLYKQQNKRMLSLAKNKLNNNHNPLPVSIIPELSKVVSL